MKQFDERRRWRRDGLGRVERWRVEQLKDEMREEKGETGGRELGTHFFSC